MADEQLIRDALALLDHDNDNHWTPDGAPRVAAVQMFGNDKTIGLNAIRRAAPDFRRRVSLTEPDVTEEPGPEPSVTDGNDPHARLKAAEADLDIARTEAREAGIAVKAARARIADAIQAWQASFPPLTDAELRRQHLASEAQLRADRAAGRIPARHPTHGPSRIDAIAAATAGATYGKGAGAFSYKRAVTGPDGTLLKGPDGRPAIPMSRGQAARAMRMKLPSER